jgi:hypothetical protein
MHAFSPVHKKELKCQRAEARKVNVYAGEAPFTHNADLPGIARF